jgi:hypothetical protein
MEQVWSASIGQVQISLRQEQGDGPWAGSWVEIRQLSGSTQEESFLRERRDPSRSGVLFGSPATLRACASLLVAAAEALEAIQRESGS